MNRKLMYLRLLLSEHAVWDSSVSAYRRLSARRIQELAAREVSSAYGRRAKKRYRASASVEAER